MLLQLFQKHVPLALHARYASGSTNLIGTLLAPHLNVLLEQNKLDRGIDCVLFIIKYLVLDVFL